MSIDLEGTCPYNGTAADFHRLEHGLPPLDCTCIDLTEKLNTFMNENAKTLKEYKEDHDFIETVNYFYNKFRDGGDWDIKLTAEWHFEEGQKYIYNCEELRVDDPGNIHYG